MLIIKYIYILYYASFPIVLLGYTILQKDFAI